MDNIENKYPVLYYDVKQATSNDLSNLINPVTDYFKRENVPFIVLPNTTSMSFMSKKDILKKLYAAIEEVEAWD